VTWGFNQTVVAALETPMLLFAPATDGQVSPQSVRAMYEDLGSDRKILVDLACASHNAMWETNRHLLFRASLEWLRSGTVNGTASGEVRLGY
jgi:esterase/lipase